MTAETITSTIRHIFSFFIPPIINLMLISVVIGESLNLWSNLADILKNLTHLISLYMQAVSSSLLDPKAFLDFLKANPEEVSKFNPSNAVQIAITDLSLALKYVSITGFVLFIFVAYVVDIVTLWLSHVIAWAFSEIKNALIEFIPSGLPLRNPTIQPLVLRPPAKPTGPEQYARNVFGKLDLDNFQEREALWRLARAWLSENAKGTLWSGEHESAEERKSALKLWLDYFRLYLALSIGIGVYSLFLRFSIQVPMIILLTLAGYLSLRYFYSKADYALRETDFKEFLYYRTAKNLDSVQAASAGREPSGVIDAD